MRTRITESQLFMGIGLTLLSIGLALWMTGCGGDNPAAPTVPPPPPVAPAPPPKPVPPPPPAEPEPTPEPEVEYPYRAYIKSQDEDGNGLGPSFACRHLGSLIPIYNSPVPLEEAHWRGCGFFDAWDVVWVLGDKFQIPVVSRPPAIPDPGKIDLMKVMGAPLMSNRITQDCGGPWCRVDEEDDYWIDVRHVHSCGDPKEDRCNQQ